MQTTEQTTGMSRLEVLKQERIKKLGAGQTVYFTSLGCSKNLVDSQVMLGHLGLSGFEMTDDPANVKIFF